MADTALPESCPHGVGQKNGGWTLESDDGSPYRGMWVHAEQACRKPSKATLAGMEVSAPAEADGKTLDDLADEVFAQEPEQPAPTTFAEAEDFLIASLPRYEPRSQQQQMARSVEAFFAQEGDEPVSLFAQAGTGTGKSLSYLIPAIQSGRRVIVTVTTKALQDQLASIDLPMLAENLGVPFTWTVLKGRSSYTCTAKMVDVDESEIPFIADLITQSQQPGFSGYREDFTQDLTHRQWAAIASDADECKANNCSERGDCFAEKARRRAKECNIVVVNHALFCTDLYVKTLQGTKDGKAAQGMIGEYDFVVSDEHHDFEEVASNCLGGEFSEGTILSLTGGIRSWATKYAQGGDQAFAGPISALQSASRALFAALPGKGTATTRLHEEDIAGLDQELGEMHTAIVALAQALNGATIEASDYERAKGRKDRLKRQGNNTYSRLIEIITADFADVVRWVDVRFPSGDGLPKRVIKVAPVDVSPFLREHLFSRTPVAMVSATMAVRGGFDFMAGRLGVDRFSSVMVDSPFDFPTQSRLYVPINLPEPKGPNMGMWETMVIEEIVRLITAAKGRTLVLFTSNQHMRKTFEALKNRVPYEIKMQGQESVRDLSTWFKANESSVLFGSRSFFTGFDAPGATCAQVILTKLPFPVPTDPIVEARCHAVEVAGGSSFSGYTVPTMSLVLQQAFGRLIRHTTDMGVAVLLDPRLVTKGYGKGLMRDLAPMPVLHDLDEVERFLEEVDQHYAALSAG